MADGANDISRYEVEVGPPRIAVARGLFRKGEHAPLPHVNPRAASCGRQPFHAAK